MMTLDPLAAARKAISATPERPATAVLFDAPEMRLVVFRLAPGQAVAPHRSASSVTLTVLEGSGILSGERDERTCGIGELVAYPPNELHGMRATTEELFLLACITPRPGARPAVAPVMALARNA
jgi:quercetin dioxygenase-like cupin family protein